MAEERKINWHLRSTFFKGPNATVHIEQVKAIKVNKQSQHSIQDPTSGLFNGYGQNFPLFIARDKY